MGRAKKNKENKRVKPAQTINPNAGDQQIQKVMMYTGIGIIAVIVVYVAFVVIQGRPPTQLDLSDQPSWGEPNAPVKVVKFGDWKCGHCKTFHDVAFPQLKEEYIDTGQVEFYFVNFPLDGNGGLGPDALTAAVGAECAYNISESMFWSYYDAIYENQPPATDFWATSTYLTEQMEVHSETEFDSEAFQQCIDNRDTAEAIAIDREVARAGEVRGTPTIFVNGELSSSSYGQLSRDIQLALEAVGTEETN